MSYPNQDFKRQLLTLLVVQRLFFKSDQLKELSLALFLIVPRKRYLPQRKHLFFENLNLPFFSIREIKRMFPTFFFVLQGLAFFSNLTPTNLMNFHLRIIWLYPEKKNSLLMREQAFNFIFHSYLDFKLQFFTFLVFQISD